MKKTCFITIGVCLVLTLTILPGKIAADSMTKLIRSNSYGQGFMGWSKSTKPDQNPIAVFNSNTTAETYVNSYVPKNQNNCGKALIRTETYVGPFHSNNCLRLSWNNSKGICEWDSKTPEASREFCDRVEASTTVDSARTTKCQIDSNCITTVNNACLKSDLDREVSQLPSDDLHYITPNESKALQEIIACIKATDVSQPAAPPPAPAVPATTKQASKKITKWELYWNTTGGAQPVISSEDKGNEIPASGPIISKTIDSFSKIFDKLPHEDINGRLSNGFSMTLYVYFDNNHTACLGNDSDKHCKKINFTIRYTAPQPVVKSGAEKCTPGKGPEFIIGSCTGKCLSANCPKDQGEGSYHTCQSNGTWDEPNGACYEECKDVCFQDKGVDVPNAPDCTYDEPCQKDSRNGTRHCTGKFINNQCIHSDCSNETCNIVVPIGPTRPIVCNTGDYKLTCTKTSTNTNNCAPCKDYPGTGEATVQQCNSEGTAWEAPKGRNPSECNSKCACGGGTAPATGPCDYPEQCPTPGEIHICHGTYEGGVCKWDPNRDPGCGDCYKP